MGALFGGGGDSSAGRGMSAVEGIMQSVMDFSMEIEHKEGNRNDWDAENKTAFTEWEAPVRDELKQLHDEWQKLDAQLHSVTQVLHKTQDDILMVHDKLLAGYFATTSPLTEHPCDGN